MPKKRLEVRSSLFDTQKILTEEQIKTDWESCKKCAALCKSRKQVVFWEGKPTAILMVVGQWPGKDEDRTGIPFAGKLGQLCRSMVCSGPVRPRDVLWTNTIGCRPPDEMPFQSRFADNCHDLLEAQLTLFKPRLLVAMGRVAMARLSGRRDVTVTEARGQVGSYKNIPVVFMGHPAILARITSYQEKKEEEERLASEINTIHRMFIGMRNEHDNTTPHVGEAR